jgi:hypothetical protein
METLEVQWCTRCGAQTLRILYPDNHDEPVAAVCDSCQYKGYFSGNKLVATEA